MKIYIIDSDLKRPEDIKKTIKSINIKVPIPGVSKIRLEPEVWIKKTDKTFISIENPFIIFLHLGDGDRFGNMGSLDFYTSESYSPNTPIIAYTAKLCREDCLNDIPESSRSKFSNVLNAIDNNKMHYFICGVHDSSCVNLPLFFHSWSDQLKNTDESNSTPPFNLLTKKEYPNLITLSMLCQGYLAAHNEESLSGWGKLNTQVKDLVISNKSATETSDWWKNNLSDVDISDAVMNELGGQISPEHPISKLLRSIYTSLPFQIDLVKASYVKLENRLKGLA